MIWLSTLRKISIQTDHEVKVNSGRIEACNCASYFRSLFPICNVTNGVKAICRWKIN